MEDLNSLRLELIDDIAMIVCTHKFGEHYMFFRDDDGTDRLMSHVEDYYLEISELIEDKLNKLQPDDNKHIE